MADAQIIDRERLAWSAGFFDGEGHCRSGFNANGAKAKHRYRRIEMIIRQIDPEVLEMFQGAVGGLGTVYGPFTGYKTPRPNSKPLWSWGVYGYEKVQAVAAMLWPFLGSVKKTQISNALVRWRTGPTREMDPSLTP